MARYLASNEETHVDAAGVAELNTSDKKHTILQDVQKAPPARP